METQDELGRLLDIARDFRFAMLVTIAEDGHLHGRPMTVAEIDDEAGAIWFITSRAREPASEVAHDARAIVTMQGKDAYVQWSGRASLVDDPLRIHEVWKPSFSLWFPDGPDEGNIVLVRVDVEIGEYWDHSGGLKVRAMLRRAKSALQGQHVDETGETADQRAHGRVHVSNGHRRDV